MADQRALHVDNVLLALGATGKYQIIQMMVSISPTLAAAIQLLSNVFTCRQVPHQCAPPPNGSAFYSKFQDLDNVTYTYETCSIVVRSNGSLVAEENCLFGMHYDLPVDASAVSQFDLVCDRASLAKLSQTLVICGQGIGAVLTTIASDRLGRKLVLIVANLGLLVGGLVIAYAPNFTVFAVFKFIVGCFQQGILTGTFTFNAELFPIKARRLNAVFCGLIWAFGVMLLSPVSYLCSDLGWRTTQTVYCSASLTLLLQIGFMDESLRWLLANGKSHRAVKVIQRAARTNGKRYEDVMSAYAGVQESKEMAPAVDEHVLEKSTKKMTLLDLLRVRRLLVNALAIWFAWFTTALGFFAIYLTSTSLSGNRFLNFFLTACMEIPSNIFFYFSLNRLGRKVTAAIPFMVLSVSLLTVGILQSLDSNPVFDILVLIFSLLGMVGASGAFGAVFSYTPEMFPTNLRNQALGISSFMGRIGGMLAPFTSVLADQAKWGPGVLIGCCACVVCILLKLLPETRGRELPQTVEDLQLWYKKDGKEKSKDGKNNVI